MYLAVLILGENRPWETVLGVSFGVLVIVFCSYSLGREIFRAPLWVTLGEKLTYSCLAGIREFEWSDVARWEWIENADEERPQSRKRMLILKFLRGGHLEVAVPPELHEEVAAVLARAITVREVPVTAWRAFGYVVLGVAILAVGLYMDYLWYIGDWPARLGVRSIFVLAVALPVGGMGVMGYGFYHLCRRRQTDS
jgi:hypothetical protein